MFLKNYVNNDGMFNWMVIDFYCFELIRYQFVRLDGSMSIKKRGKVVDNFNNPEVIIIFSY